jgi:hypothetical protein
MGWHKEFVNVLPCQSIALIHKLSDFSRSTCIIRMHIAISAHLPVAVSERHIHSARNVITDTIEGLKWLSIS